MIFGLESSLQAGVFTSKIRSMREIDESPSDPLHPTRPARPRVIHGPCRRSTKSAGIRHGAESFPELQRSIADNAIAVEKRMKDKQLGSADHPGSVPYLLRLPAVLRTTGLGRSTLYRLISERAFPPPVKLAKRAVAWRQEEVQQWAGARARAAHRQGPEV
jgi:prophage regulatory protein